MTTVMTQLQAVEGLLKFLRSAFPSSKTFAGESKNKDIVVAWAKILQGIPPDMILAAGESLIKKNPFVPSAPEVLAEAQAIQADQRRQSREQRQERAIEGWKEALPGDKPQRVSATEILEQARKSGEMTWPETNCKGEILMVGGRAVIDQVHGRYVLTNGRLGAKAPGYTTPLEERDRRKRVECQQK